MTKKMVIGLASDAGHGKDTAGKVLEEFGFQRVAFADPIRELLYQINPWILDDESRPVRYQEVIDARGFDWAKRHIPEVRRLAQFLGNMAREIIHPDVWTDIARRKIQNCDRSYISDVRYPSNEPQVIKEHDGYIIGIERPGYKGDASIDKSHPSERNIDKIPKDIKIINEEDKLDKFRADIRSALHTLFGSELLQEEKQ